MSSVLVVDDNEPLGRLLTQTLDRAGHASRWAATAAQAIKEVAAFAPEVVLLDLQLPDTPGPELAAALRASLPAARIIGISGDMPAHAVRNQFDAFLLKPVPLDTLLAAVEDRDSR